MRAAAALSDDLGERVGEPAAAADCGQLLVGVQLHLGREHLQLVGSGPESRAERVRSAGCVFVGQDAGTAFGDYIAGSNHILPTAGAARFASGLTPRHFLRTATEVRIAQPDELARAAAPVARAEGFELHARSMEARIRDNQQP